MTGLSELQIIFLISGATVGGIVVIIKFLNLANSKSDNTAGTDTPDKSIKLAKITIYSPDGKELKTYMADYIYDYYSEGRVNFIKEGKQITLIAGINLIEVSYL